MESTESPPESHLEEEIDTQLIKKRSITGAVAYVTRTFLLHGVGLVALILLGIFLSEKEFGIFFIVEATVSFLVYFSDIGLAAALIQKKKPLTRKDLTTTFTIQQILVVALTALALLFSNKIGQFYNFGNEAVFLFNALVIAFFLSSLKTIPSILLERKLEFSKLIAPQILENIVFYSVAVYLAWKGFGIRSYTWAVLLRAVVGLVAIYALKPWLPGFSFNRNVAKKLIRFGAPFQLHSILSLFKDKALIIFLGVVLGPSQVGLLGWAEKWALTPIRMFVDPVLKVTFPAYSRLQNNKTELKKAVEKSIFFVSFFAFPSIAGLVILAPSFVSNIPGYSKWEPALLALGLFSINSLFSSVSITLTNTLNATGRVTTTLKLILLWTILTWVLTPLLIFFFGFTGVALASAITASTSLIAVYLVKRIVKIKVLDQVSVPILGSAAMSLLIWFISPLLTTSLLTTLLTALLGASFYFVLTFILARQKITSELAILKKYLTK